MKKLLRKKVSMAVLFVALTLGITSGVYQVKKNLSIQTFSYTDFIKQVEKKQVDKIYLSPEAKIQAVLKNGKVIYFPNPRVEDFKEKMLLKNVEVIEDHRKGYVYAIFNALFSLTILGALFYMLKKVLPKMSKRSGKDFGNIQVEQIEKVETRFEDIAGNTEAKESVQELIDFIQNPKKYVDYGARMPRGIIFYGPPGTGKTLMAKAIAGEAGVPFFSVSGSDFVQMYVGVGASRIRSLFLQARKAGKCIIFIDEIDAIGKKRDASGFGGNDERDQTLNALLTEMSGFHENQGIVVIAATNRLDILDDALLRPGRFDRHIEIGLPDANAREQILRLYVKNKPLDEKISIRKLAEQTIYFSGAKLESLLNEAAIFAAKRNAAKIQQKDIDQAFYTVIAGAEKKDRSGISREERAITAYHEAGHALITKLIAKENRVTKVTIIPSTKGAGGFSMNIPPDKMYETKTEMENQIKISLAGRVAEELIFGENEITTGASSDIQKATRTLKQYMERFGMSKKLGLLNYDEIFGEGHHRIVDEERLNEYKEKMAMFYEETKELMMQNMDYLEAIAEALLKKETLSEEDIDEILKEQKQTA